MAYFEPRWPVYVRVGDRRKQAEKEVAKAKKSGQTLSPIAAFGGAIAKTFWGKAWCDNLERYSDYANRLPRGRTYVRNGSVIDLQITAGTVQAQVMGSSLYRVRITVEAVAKPVWGALLTDCAGSVASLVELLQGKLSKGVMERLCVPRTGLFPATKELRFSCSCPDSASMCKHVAAVFYGVGARLDHTPEVLFQLRNVDVNELVAKALTAQPAQKAVSSKRRALDTGVLADVFGIEMADAPARSPVAKKTPVATAKKAAVVKKTAAAKKTAVTKKTTVTTAKKTTVAKRITVAKGNALPKTTRSGAR